MMRLLFLGDLEDQVSSTGRLWLVAVCNHHRKDMATIGVPHGTMPHVIRLLESHTSRPIAISLGQWRVGSVEASRLFWRSRAVVAGEYPPRSVWLGWHSTKGGRLPAEEL
jgi:hypothetical protein